MSTIIEYNDWQLQVFAHRGENIYSDMAAAAFIDGQLHFGGEAWRHARSKPQNFNNRYLANLNADPVSGDLGVAKNHADLIYHHLRALPLAATDTESVVFCVSGYVSNEQLGMLLGICEEAGLQVAGFVDLALAHALPCVADASLAEPLQQGNLYVLDFEQHRLSLSQVLLQNSTLSVQQSRTFDGLGLLSIIDGWMNVIADEFVQNTRFDPTHSGESEQQMLNQVYTWFSNGKVDPRVRIDHNGSQRQIEVSALDLKEKLGQRLAGLELDSKITLALTSRAQAVPGLSEYLGGRVQRLVHLQQAAAASSYADLAARLASGQVTRLQTATVNPPTTPSATPSSTTPSATTRGTLPGTTPHREEATHLLHEHRAVALTAAQFAGHAKPGALQTGDQVEIAGTRYVAIRVT